MTEPDLIRQQMAQIRHDLHKDVSSVRGDVEQALDWKSLPRHYPLASIIAAVAAGYVIVPQRSTRNGAVASVHESPAAVRSRPWRGFGAHVLDLVWPLTEQALQTYAAIWIENWIRRNLGHGPAPVESSGENGPGMAPGMEFFNFKSSDRR